MAEAKRSALDEKPANTVLIVGAGPVGLINARTLVRDGFRVTMIAKVGVHVWAAHEALLIAVGGWCGRMLATHISRSHHQQSLGQFYIFVRPILPSSQSDVSLGGCSSGSGLAMARPSSLDGSVVPARTYLRYLEDFHHYFLSVDVDTR